MQSHHESLAATHPREAEWIFENMGRNSFAESLNLQLARRGYLSVNQVAAVTRNVERIASTKSADVDTGVIEAVFARVNPTLKKPAINVGPYRFSRAPDINPRTGLPGANPGALYVKREGEYLGKMLKGQFLTRASMEVVNEVLAIAADPLGKAIEHGKLTGRCAICNRNLKDEDSTDRGIGPICAKKFGWAE